MIDHHNRAQAQKGCADGDDHVFIAGLTLDVPPKGKLELRATGYQPARTRSVHCRGRSRQTVISSVYRRI